MSDMYDWITDENMNPLAGQCPHNGHYCYVETQLKPRYPGMRAKYSGPVKLSGAVLEKTVKGGTRFLCSCTDLFAAVIPNEYIAAVLDWAEQQDTVTWAIQTKNPKHPMFRDLIECRPINFMLGITRETRPGPAGCSGGGNNRSDCLGFYIVTSNPNIFIPNKTYWCLGIDKPKQGGETMKLNINVQGIDEKDYPAVKKILSDAGLKFDAYEVRNCPKYGGPVPKRLYSGSGCNRCEKKEDCYSPYFKEGVGA